MNWHAPKSTYKLAYVKSTNKLNIRIKYKRTGIPKKVLINWHT